MKQRRISRPCVERLAECLKLRLVTHQNLGNRKDYYYSYSVVRDDEKGNYKETLLEDKELKEAYKFLGNLLDIECERLGNEERSKI